MAQSRVEKRLKQNSDRLKKLHDDLRVADEQLIQLADEADDARLRSLVSETPLADREHRDAGRHADKMRKHRESVATEIAKLEAAQDELLDQLTGS